MNLATVYGECMASLSRVALFIATTGLVAMTFTIGLQVFARYVLNESPPWTEALALLLMLYFILLAAAIGVREGFHLRVRVILDHLPDTSRGLFLRGIDVLVGLFGACMAMNGLRLAEVMSEHTIPTLGITRAVAYWPFIAGGALMFLFSIERVIRGGFEIDGGLSSNS